jgi:hypothetical protein
LSRWPRALTQPSKPVSLRCSKPRIRQICSSAARFPFLSSAQANRCTIEEISFTSVDPFEACLDYHDYVFLCRCPFRYVLLSSGECILLYLGSNSRVICVQESSFCSRCLASSLAIRAHQSSVFHLLGCSSSEYVPFLMPPCILISLAPPSPGRLSSGMLIKSSPHTDAFSLTYNYILIPPQPFNLLNDGRGDPSGLSCPWRS